MLIQANALQIPLPDHCVDMVFADPPYGITRAEWDEALPMGDLWAEMKRIRRAGAAIVITSMLPFACDVIGANRGEFRYEWVFAKTNPSGFLNANRMPLRAHENVLVFYDQLPTYNPQMGKGKPYHNYRSKQAQSYGKHQRSNGGSSGARYPTTVLQVKSERPDDLIHPSQKPETLLAYLIRTYTNPGDLILDPFVGSGTTVKVARELGRRAIGLDLSMPYLRLAQERNRQMTLWEA